MHLMFYFALTKGANVKNPKSNARTIACCMSVSVGMFDSMSIDRNTRKAKWLV